MKHITTKTLSVLLALVMVLSLATVTAFAKSAGYSLWVGGTLVSDENLSGEGWSFTPAKGSDPATLTLNGAAITAGYAVGNKTYGIYYSGAEALRIELASGSENTVAKESGAFTSGVYSVGEADVTIAGEGTLTTTGSASGVNVFGNLTISSGTVNATGTQNAAIMAQYNLTVKGGTVNANANCGGSLYGIYAPGKIAIEDGTVKADGAFLGIACNGGFITTGGEVEASGGMNGIASNDITIQDGSVIATGNTAAIEVTVSTNPGVKNQVKGLGWTDTNGTEGETEIPVSKEGQKLTYKKVQFFPAPAPVVPDEPAVPAASSALTVTSEIGTITRVTVDGKAVDSKYYTVSGNSVVLSDEFMRSLSNGTHTIRLYDGATYATATWTVSGNDTPAITAPKTADPGVALYGLLAVSSTFGLAFVGKKRKDD